MKLPKYLYAIIWVMIFPLAMWYLKKTEGLTSGKLLTNFVWFLNVWIWSIVIIKYLLK